MRVIFMGTPEFAVPTLRALHDVGHDIVLVVAQPDKPVGRGQKMASPPVAVAAKELGLPLAQPVALKKGPFPERFVGLHADVAVVLAYGRILPLQLLNAPKYGCVNVHASLLPRWRGAAPIQAAVLAGDAVSGVCTQRMEESLDTGPLYFSRAIDLDPRETAGTLHDRLMGLSAEVAVDTLREISFREPVPQDHSAATWAGKIDKDHGFVDWRRSALDHDRQIRAMTPWPGGSAAWGTERLKILEATPLEGTGAPGTVLSTTPLVVACLEGALRLDVVQAPGRKPVRGPDFANGARIVAGGPL